MATSKNTRQTSSKRRQTFPKPRQTKAEKRVAIAKDVIAQIKAEKYKALTGNYVGIDEVIDGNTELQSELKKVKKCEVCALGSLFISDVRKNDRCKGIDVSLGTYYNGYGIESLHYIDSRAMRDRLRKLFSDKQMALIEAAFEHGYEAGGEDNLSDAVINKCADFAGQFAADKDRLIAIMRNIIRNGGEFKLPKRIRSVT